VKIQDVLADEMIQLGFFLCGFFLIPECVEIQAFLNPGS